MSEKCDNCGLTIRSGYPMQVRVLVKIDALPEKGTSDLGWNTFCTNCSLDTRLSWFWRKHNDAPSLGLGR